MTPDEQASLLNLLFDKLNHQKENKIKVMDTKLLYRASDNEYKCDLFWDKCVDKGPTNGNHYNGSHRI